MTDAMFSPDTDDIIEAISIIKKGATIVPEDIDAAVPHIISTLGGEAITVCSGKGPEFKRGFVIGWAHHMRTAKG